MDPDVLLSIVCGQWIGPELRETPDDSIDLHGSLLPKYRGRARGFWPRYHGDDEAGVPAHVVTDEWDAGPIIDQAFFPLGPDGTVHDVYRRIWVVGAALALDVLDAVADGRVETRPTPTIGEDYHSLPTPAERREFRSRGKRFV